MATKLGSLHYDLTLNDKELNAKLAAVNGKMQGFGDKMNNVGKKMSDTGKKMTLGLTTPIVGGMAAASKSAINFEQRMSDISTLISGDSTKAVGELKDGILEMTQTVPASPDELGASAYQIMSAGINESADALKVLEDSSKLATSGLATTEEATDMMTGALNSFGFEAKDSDEVADILFKTVKNGKTDISQLSQAFGSTAPILAEAKVELTEFSAATAAMTTTNLPASQAQNQLRQAVVSLQKPTSEMTDLFEKAGIESLEASIKQDGLVGTMEKIKTAADGDSEALARAWGSTEALGAATSLTGKTSDAFASTLEDMENGANAMGEAFDKQSETTGNKLKMVKNQFTALGISIGDQLAPHLEELGNRISRIIEWFDGLSPKQQKMMLQAAGIVAALGPLLIIFGKMAQGVSALVKVMSFLGNTFVITAAKAAVSATKTAASWALAGVKVIGQAIAMAATHVASAASAAAAWIAANAVMLLGIGLIIAAVIGLAVVIIKNWETIKKWLSAFWNWLKDIALSVWDWIKQAALTLVNAIVAYFRFYLKIYKAVFRAALAIVRAVFRAVWSVVSWVFNRLKNAVIFYRNLISGAFGFIKRTIIAVFRGAWNTVRSIWSGVGNFFSRLKNGIVNTFSRVKGQISAPFKAAFNSIAGFWNRTVGKLDFQAPDWVPGMGGKGWSLPKLPTLAAGGVATGPTMAMIGEAGNEAVLPLSELDRYNTLFSRIENTAEKMETGSMAAGGGDEIHLHLDGVMARSKSELREIGNNLVNAINEERRAKGKKEI